MAAAIEAPAQFERDLRSAHKGWKRDKDSSQKWHLGHRPAAGVKWCAWTGEVTSPDLPDSLLSKSRPMKKHSYDGYTENKKKKSSNAIKANRSHHGYWLGGNGRLRGRLGAQGDMDDPATSRSMVDLLVPAARKEGGAGDNTPWGLQSMEGVLYSYDAKDTPSRPVTLESFVKANNRTTEKLVEKEYEILDVNGDLLKGRKARKDLHKSANGIGVSPGDDDDFELV